ncbi:hypothetical protein [Pseudoalteromonas obscura]|uniref:Uncharacterized protein n=1 Tax=Pseudoalteromonas obscura TaxID=3048491 RepID=A0ABT7EF46_9GAMM|nr:hypothetical protein [Pseudoalteromonas sp. P94(2023)]MDK2593900.1 hypothetical protein [Pseudoalteromonas sp. P94(2023)]
MTRAWHKAILFTGASLIFSGNAQTLNVSTENKTPQQIASSEQTFSYEFKLEIGDRVSYDVTATLVEGEPGEVIYYDAYSQPTYKIVLIGNIEKSEKLGIIGTVKHSIQKYAHGQWTELLAPEMTYRNKKRGALEVYNDDMLRISLSGIVDAENL